MYNVCEWKWVIMNYKDIENSIIKKFRKTIWVRFVRAINEYNLIEPNDKIMVCIPLFAVPFGRSFFMPFQACFS